MFFSAPSSFIFGTWCLCFFRLFFQIWSVKWILIAIAQSDNCQREIKSRSQPRYFTILCEELQGRGSGWGKRRFTVGRNKMHSLIDRQWISEVSRSADYLHSAMFHLLPLWWLSADVLRGVYMIVPMCMYSMKTKPIPVYTQCFQKSIT